MSGSWRLVPVDPNTPQRRIGQAATGIMDLGHDAYTRMVIAAPTPPDEVLERMAEVIYSRTRPDGYTPWEKLHPAEKRGMVGVARAALSAAGEKNNE